MLQDGVFFAAKPLFGITFTERTDLVGYHPDVRVFEVKNADGTRSASTSSISTRATPSAAAPG